MTVFLDSNFFVAILNTRDHNYKRALTFLDRFKAGDLGARLTSDYVLDEVITTIWSQTHRKDLVVKAYELICNTPDFVHIQIITKGCLALAYNKWKQFAEWPKRPLSYTDCTILAMMETQNIDQLLSFDEEFEGLVPRLK
ncbi:MAG: type II toxin-antitoxin system VapC family toxin [Candidatus Ranarchaeia archaeon]